jgi:protein-glutamine gamma-glutamyltransferase
MRLDNLFRLSFYITLGLAVGCLTVAESFFLPWLGMCLPALAIVFVLAWRKEGVWVLGEAAANHLGIVIALAAAGWILIRIPQTDEQILASGVPWPAGLLPQLAPVLIILLVVKLFRPKRLPDFWVIQTIALMMITLGCVLAYQETFGILLLAYLASLMWTLMLFHFYREQRLSAGPDTSAISLFDPLEQAPDSAHAVRLPWRRLGLYPVALWLTAIVALGLPLFFVMPRMAAQQWVPQKLSGSAPRSQNMQTGVESGIDLFRVGHIEPSPEEAFSVSVRDDADNPCPLPGALYWRTDVLDIYQRGRWQNWKVMEEQFDAPFLAPPGGPAPPPGPIEPPQRLRLRFVVRPVRLGSELVLAEPVATVENNSLKELDALKKRIGTEARIGERASRNELFHARKGCDSLLTFVLTARQLYHYGQELELPAQRERTPAHEISVRYRDYLLNQPVPDNVRAWTRELVKHLSGISAADLDFDDDYLLPRHQGKVARALARYLSTTGLFRYSLDLRRKDFNADPTEDFLLNTKQGHCERYASGLALMLRGLGIPARIVKGYWGGEKKTELGADDELKEVEGEYLIRQAQAHSWVQALVPENGQWFWLLLNPTPAAEASKGETFSLLAWLGQGLRDGRYFWYNFILEYNNEMQAASAHSLTMESLRGLHWVGRYASWTTPPLLLFWLAWYGRGAWRRSLAAQSAAPALGAEIPPFYARYLRLLAEHFQLLPQVGQTPLEFSGRAAAALRGDARTAPWGPLPEHLTDALYRLRFGGEPLDAIEQVAFASHFAALECALSKPVEAR